MKSIPINLIHGLCPTLMSRAFEKARISYYLGQAKVWHYPAIIVITDDKKKSKHVEAVIRKHWRELVKGVVWIDGYNNAVHKDTVTAVAARTYFTNQYFFNDPRKASGNKSL